MIKIVAFDLDNTLMKWKEEYICVLDSILKKYNYSYSDEIVKLIDKAITDYEDDNTILTNIGLLEYVNKKCNVNLKINVIDDLIIEQGNCFEKYSNKSKELLEYLSKKYKLCVVTNWFTKTQINRLRNAGILDYFSFVTGGDEHELKPSLKAFSIITNPSECIMIGDSISKDIEPALKLGMKAILLTNKKVKRDDRYKKIRKLEDLREML